MNEGLLGFAAGESDGAAPAGTAYAAAGSSPGFSHQPVPRTSSAAARTPEGKAVGIDGAQPSLPHAVISAEADLSQGLMGRMSHRRTVFLLSVGRDPHSPLYGNEWEPPRTHCVHE